ncbi:endonuclease/exonuclease/phosphatase family protein [Frankia sp. R82]|uniref:endonuclease/exonuclease/phosphatase family protein n=1 Tax=Frankia sp. R82 TaxID=2950553 RepID=UPI0020431017|nr:endonuclease/exonuclease/phosphatase family protein [Frankia sp. R82]MCM3883117.1 endonuclease/exonuclease/phosphatase family protein [Frankia sp. R82]
MNRQQSLFPDPPTPAAATSTAELRLVTFNAQHAGPDRARRQAAWLSQQPDADVVVLTEVGHGPGGHALLDALTQHGYPHLHTSTPDGPDYRTVIASRQAPLEPVPTGIDVLAHRAPAVDLQIGAQRLRLIGLYVPSRGPAERRNQNKRAFQHAVTRALPGILAAADGPVVVTGDLNVVEPGHVPHYPVFGAWEYDFYRSFTDAGLTDAYRALHPDTPGHSWYGRGGNGYRFDHTFLTTRRLHLTSCDYVHTPRLDGLSDHAALSLTAHPSAAATDPFSFDKAAGTGI